MGKVTDGVKGLFDRIGAFFDLFDLSFFISGVTSLGALTFWGVRSNRWPLFELGGALKVIAAILASYVLGLVCFASGRLIRKAALRLVQQFTGSRNDIFKDRLEAHQLTSLPTFAGYLTRDKLPELCYRLWAEMRQPERFAPSLSFINRYWVMAATYDGVAVALLLWLGAVVALWAQGRLALST